MRTRQLHSLPSRALLVCLLAGGWEAAISVYREAASFRTRRTRPDHQIALP